MGDGEVILIDSLDVVQSCGSTIDLASTYIGCGRCKVSSRGFSLSASVVERGISATGIDTAAVARSNAALSRHGNNTRRGGPGESGLGVGGQCP